MSNNKQSSVEWYIEKILDLDYEYAKGLITLGVWSERKNALIEQAKAMHKEEIIRARLSLDRSNMSDFPKALNNATDYYNETFGGNK